MNGFGTSLQVEVVRERLRAAGNEVGVRAAPILVRGDRDLNPTLEPRSPLVPAAVLVPLVQREEALTVLLTRRTDHLADHAGQISFPGGRIEPFDRDPIAAALREAQEEIGLDESTIEIAGRLDTYQTGTGFEVTPVVGLVTPPVDLSPDPIEVAEVFEVPLAFILDPANHQRETRHYRGVERRFWVLPYRHYYIWGATAAMLVNLSEVLRET
jgi:8-oxo-dGTP pyrophosphatase MutT (NUDIX family)